MKLRAVVLAFMMVTAIPAGVVSADVGTGAGNQATAGNDGGTAAGNQPTDDGTTGDTAANQSTDNETAGDTAANQSTDDETTGETVGTLSTDNETATGNQYTADMASAPAAGPVDVDPSDLDGDGTEWDPYVITNASELQAISEQPEGDTHYVLGNDIDASETETWNDGKGFSPIAAGYFTLDGRGHTISGLTIDRPSQNGTALFGYGRYTVLRNISVTDAKVRGANDVGVILGNGDILIENVTVEGSVSGDENVGGVVGFGEGIMRNSSADVSVTGEDNVGGLIGWNDGFTAPYDTPGRVGRSSARGSVSGSNNVGGLVGLNEVGIVVESSADVAVQGENDVGGAIGDNNRNSKLNKTYATGTVTGSSNVGGLVGDNAGSRVYNSYAAGKVVGTDSVGGLVGKSDSNYVDGSVTDSYWNSNTTGQNSSAGGTPLTTAQMTGTAAPGNMSGFNFDTKWQTGPEYPRLFWEDLVVNVPPNATDDKYIEDRSETVVIGSPGLLANDTDRNGDQLSVEPAPVVAPTNGTVELNADGSFEYSPGASNRASFVYRVTDGNGGTDTATVNITLRPSESGVAPGDLAGNGTETAPYVITNASELQAMEDAPDAAYVLGNDIDATATVAWNDGSGFDPVGVRANGFTGTFDGQGHTISGLTIARPDENDVGLFGVVSAGGTVTNVSLDGTSVSGLKFVGGLVGTNAGTVTESSVHGTVDGQRGVGGLAGYNENSLRDATANATVNGTDSIGGLVGRNTYTGTVRSTRGLGKVVGDRHVGGLVGTNGKTITRSSSNATVVGDRNVGGLVGRTVIASATVSNSAATGHVEARDTGGGLVGGGGGGIIRNSYAAVTFENPDEKAGLAAGYASQIENSYWDVNTTGVSVASDVDYTGVGDNVTGLRTEQMTGDAARTNMTGLDFGQVWQPRPGDYPGLGTRISRNAPPVADGEQYSITSRETLSIPRAELLANDGDADGDALVVERITHGPANGTVTLSDEALAYTPENGFTGQNRITYVVSDGNGGTDTANITVAVRVDENPSDLVGNGTSADPYVITNASELQAVKEDTDAVYVLGGDIDARNTGAWNNGSGFDPIGVRANGFTGTFDGQGHTIRGLAVARPDEDDVGLFGVVSAAGTVRNVSLDQTSVSGRKFVGGLVGTNAGTVTGSSVHGTVDGQRGVGGLAGFNENSLRDATANATVNGTKSIGGLVGRNTYTGTVRSSRGIGKAVGTENVGGLVGTNGKTVTRSFSNATVVGDRNVGGLVGHTAIASATVSKSAATGHIEAYGAGGGLVGEGGTIRDSYAAVTFEEPRYNSGLVDGYASEVEDSYWDTNTTGVTEASDSLYIDVGDNVTGLTTEQMTGDAARTNMTGLDFETVWVTVQDEYPKLAT